MAVKLANEVVIKTEHEVIREGDLIWLIHKDGRQIRGKLKEIRGQMIYVNDEVLHLGMIEEMYISEVN